MAQLLSAHRFERQWYQSGWVNVIAGSSGAFLGYISILLFGLYPPIQLSLLSITLLLLAGSFDIVTTQRVFALKGKYHERGIEFPFVEENPLLPPSPTFRDLLFGRPTFLLALASLLTFFIPPVGWGISGALFAVSLNNYRNRQQADYSLHLYDRMSSKDGKKKEIPTKGYLCAIPTDMDRDSKGSLHRT